MASRPQSRRVRSRSKFNAIGQRKRTNALRGRPMVVRHFTAGTVLRLRLAAKRKAYGIKARSAIIMRQRRAVAVSLRRGRKKVT